MMEAVATWPSALQPHRIVTDPVILRVISNYLKHFIIQQIHK